MTPAPPLLLCVEGDGVCPLAVLFLVCNTLTIGRKSDKKTPPALKCRSIRELGTVKLKSVVSLAYTGPGDEFFSSTAALVFLLVLVWSQKTLVLPVLTPSCFEIAGFQQNNMAVAELNALSSWELGTMVLLSKSGLRWFL